MSVTRYILRNECIAYQMCQKTRSLLSDSPKQFPKLSLYGFSSVCGKPNPLFLGSFGCSRERERERESGLRIIDDKKKGRYHVVVREKSEESIVG